MQGEIEIKTMNFGLYWDLFNAFTELDNSLFIFGAEVLSSRLVSCRPTFFTDTTPWNRFGMNEDVLFGTFDTLGIENLSWYVDTNDNAEFQINVFFIKSRI